MFMVSPHTGPFNCIRAEISSIFLGFVVAIASDRFSVGPASSIVAVFVPATGFLARLRYEPANNAVALFSDRHPACVALYSEFCGI